jgi:hypothetical protein
MKKPAASTRRVASACPLASCSRTASTWARSARSANAPRGALLARFGHRLVGTGLVAADDDGAAPARDSTGCGALARAAATASNHDLAALEAACHARKSSSGRAARFPGYYGERSLRPCWRAGSSPGSRWRRRVRRAVAPRCPGCCRSGTARFRPRRGAGHRWPSLRSAPACRRGPCRQLTSPG